MGYSINIDPIKPNGAAELNKALPKDGAKHVLMLREAHAFPGHACYLIDHLEELKTKHNVGTIGVECAPFMMAYIWAYRDAAPGQEKEAARKLLKDTFVAFYGNQEAVNVDIELYTKAMDHGINLICFDTRHSLTVERARLELAKEKNPEYYLVRAEELQKYQTFLDAHPEYKKRIEALEAPVLQMIKERHMPFDIVSAKMFDLLADPTKNAITISGVNHLADGSGSGAEGIFDECMAANQWSVTDALIANQEQMPQIIAMYRDKRNFQGRGKPAIANPDAPRDYIDVKPLRDHIDFVWEFDTDIVAHPPARPDPGEKNPPLGLDYDIFSKADGEAPESAYNVDINTQLTPKLEAIIQEIRKAYAAPPAPAKNNATKTPTIKR